LGIKEESSNYSAGSLASIAFVLNVIPEADFLHEQGEWFRKARYLVSIKFAGFWHDDGREL
jgi:hypothetical protein